MKDEVEKIEVAHTLIWDKTETWNIWGISCGEEKQGIQLVAG